ncbi:succinate dehydrogenase, cytochrome b556 subunit [Methylonatrum kenyense]|uniref:succinate dehydrogenase, cytochrome b556 subunit n=1 Tax=Methylonatrum kenyense TaxID=455253 RepID=UPI0020BEB35F|nr:succinate dehydrogenase, cytochrome b556 subunit [Methylonatrum kenyense]MCK8514756.1 succinate dehydrogenase, cytochrome b556 subunit [Methylonatrum kenyense]
MHTKQRPLSPHLQVYRPQLTSAMSICHRISGVALSVGTLLLTYWLVAAAAGPEAYARAQSVLGGFFGSLILFAFTGALFYHLCNGIRHLMWDAGYGFNIPTVYRSGYAVMIAAAVLTVLVWLLALLFGGS